MRLQHNILICIENYQVDLTYKWKSLESCYLAQLVSQFAFHTKSLLQIFPAVPAELLLLLSSRPRLGWTRPLQRSSAAGRGTPRGFPRSSTAPCRGPSPHGTRGGRPRQRTCWRGARRSPLFRNTCAPARPPLETN